MPWFEESPERLNFELRQLEEFGFPYEIDPERRSAGELALTVRCPIDGAEHPLRVVYPAAYPFFPFQVHAPTLELAHHQDPYAKTLCFVARIDSEWVTTDTIGVFLRDRLPEVIKANCGDPEVQEAQEGAPATGFLIPMPGSLVITGDLGVSDQITRGSLMLGFEAGSNPNELFRGVVLEIRDLSGESLGSAPATLARRIGGRCEGRWVRFSQRPQTTDPIKVLEEAIAVWPELRQPFFRGGPDVIGIVFKDDARYREKHDLWTFLIRRKERDVVARRKNKRLPPGNTYTVYLARADRGAQDDVGARVPRVKALATKKAAIFGLGALGSTVAVQLAKAGIERLHLVDYDYLQAGNLPRWAVGWPGLGRQKVDVLISHIQQNYPFVQVVGSNFKIGAPGIDETEKALDAANIIIDCSVELTVHHYLSHVGWTRGLPYVWMSATAGGWGGIVGRSWGGSSDGCWKCFKYHQTAGQYRIPSEEEGADIQPVGCFSPTFTGTGFDLDLIALAGVRLSIATLCKGTTNGYPDFDWDIGIANFWSDNRPIAGDWEVHRLVRHPNCDEHD